MASDACMRAYKAQTECLREERRTADSSSETTVCGRMPWLALHLSASLHRRGQGKRPRRTYKACAHAWLMHVRLSWLMARRLTPEDDADDACQHTDLLYHARCRRRWRHAAPHLLLAVHYASLYTFEDEDVEHGAVHSAPGRAANAGVPHHDATRKMASYLRIAATRATLIRRLGPSKLAPPEEGTAAGRRDFNNNTTPLRSRETTP
jgi:hypothetical protein